MSFECEIRSDDGDTIKVIVDKVDRGFATVAIMETEANSGDFINLNEPSLRTLAIALNMAADELKERGK
jgi:hypothetical protein